MENRFRKYDHIERIGHPDVGSIDIGLVHIFPKLDGTNSSIWLEDTGTSLCAGSRTRTLSPEADNAGFHAWTRTREEDLIKVLRWVGSECHVYGEWLVPHTLKTYRQDAWRRFWVFDVYHPDRGYLPYDEWAEKFEAADFDVVSPLCTIENPTEDQLHHQVEMNTFLVADNAGAGEGIVLKNFKWQNTYGRQPWAKIVRNEFKESNRKAFGTPELKGAFQIEAAIAEEYVTPTLVAKCRAKIIQEVANDENPPMWGTPAEARQLEEKHRGKIIPRLLQTVYTDVLREELYMVIKKYKDPTIDFKKLRAQCIRFTKEYAADLF